MVTFILFFAKKWFIVNTNKSETKRSREAPGYSEVLAFTLTMIIVVAAFLYTERLYENQTLEPFSEFSILGPDMKMSDYPSVLKVSEPFHLCVYVANRMGKSMHYLVMAKYAAVNTTVDPSPGTVIGVSERILLDNETYTFPFEIVLKEDGFWRLIFELWAYNSSTGDAEYLSPYWGQIWVNVTL